MDLSRRDPVNTNAPGQQKNKNGPPGPVGNKNGPPTTTATTAEASTTSPIQTPPLASPLSAISPPASFTSTSNSPFTPPPTISAVPITASTSKVSLSIRPSSVTSTSVTLTPLMYYQTSLTTSEPALVKTTLEITRAGTSSSATSLTTGLTSFPPNNVVQVRHGALGPDEKAGIVVGTIAGIAFVMTFIYFFKWRRSKPSKAMPCLGWHLLDPRGTFPWLYRTQTPANMSDSPLPPESGSRSSLRWDHRSTFAQPTVTGKSRKSLPWSLRTLARFNPLGQNPVKLREETSNRNSFASFFRRRSTTTATRRMVDVESPPVHPPLPASPSTPQHPAVSAYRDSLQSDMNEFPRSQTISAQILPPAFHRPLLYRNSHTTSASMSSGTQSFNSVPGGVRFHYLHRELSDSTALREPLTPLPAPQAFSPGSWLKAKFLRRSQSTSASTEKRESQAGSDIGYEEASIGSPVPPPSVWKQAEMGLRTSRESVESLGVEIQVAWQI